MPDSSDRRNWTRVAFGDVVKLTKERSSDPLADGFMRYIGLEHIEPNDLKIRAWGDIADGTTFTSVFRPGQVLFGKRRAYQRKIAVADFSGVCSSDIYVLEPADESLLPELLPFLCQSDAFFNHAVGTSAGSLSPRTNWKSLAEYEFALPPLEEQRRIAEVLQAAEEYSRSLRCMMRLRQTLRMSLLNGLFGREAGGIAVGELIDVGPQNGLYKPASSYGTGVPILRIDSFEQGELTSVLSWKRIDVDDEEAALYRLKHDDIVINRVNSRDFVGQCAVVGTTEEAAVFESNMMRFSVRQDLVRADLVAALINHPRVQKQVASRRKDAINQSSINQADVKSLVIPKISAAEQDRYMGVLIDLDRAVAAAERRLESFRLLKAGLLSCSTYTEVSP